MCYDWNETISAKALNSSNKIEIQEVDDALKG